MSKKTPEIPPAVQRAGAAAVRHYMAMVAAGESERLAELLALQCPPGVYTPDTTFIRDLGVRARRSQDANLDESAGGGGKTYIPEIAAFPNDPDAYVTSLHDVKALCRARGWSVKQTMDSGLEIETGGSARDWKKLLKKKRKEYKGTGFSVTPK